MALRSTWPGAITVLRTHFYAVANANPPLHVGVYVGIPVAQVADNYLMIGEPETGQLVLAGQQDFMAMPASAARKEEEYTIPCNLRTWAGDSTPTSRITDAGTLFDGVVDALQADPQGSTALSPSGTWQVDEFEVAASGPFQQKGWGVLLTFNVRVVNVRIPN